LIGPGGDLLSHPVSRAVPSALKGLTAGFGMGPGVSPSLWPPETFEVVSALVQGDPERSRASASENQALGLLVPVA
jgi:hypothetical protein